MPRYRPGALPGTNVVVGGWEAVQTMPHITTGHSLRKPPSFETQNTEDVLFLRIAAAVSKGGL